MNCVCVCVVPVHGQWCKGRHFHSRWYCSSLSWDTPPDHWHRQLNPLKVSKLGSIIRITSTILIMSYSVYIDHEFSSVPYDGLRRKDKSLPVHVLRMMQWSMMGLQLTVISKQWCALWCWADLSSGLNCGRDTDSFRSFFQMRIHLKREKKLFSP